MSEEEKKAIEELNKVRKNNYFLFCDDIRIVLNLIEKQTNIARKEYNEHMEKKRQCEVLEKNNLILQKEIEKQNKMIDLMASYILKNTCVLDWDGYEPKVKEYFRKKVETNE